MSVAAVRGPGYFRKTISRNHNTRNSKRKGFHTSVSRSERPVLKVAIGASGAVKRWAMSFLAKQRPPVFLNSGRFAYELHIRDAVFGLTKKFAKHSKEEMKKLNSGETLSRISRVS
jgi:hypothetical protein